MIAATRFPLRSDPAKSQFLRPRAHGRIWLSGSQTRLKQLMAALDAWPAGFRSVELEGRLEHIRRQMRKTLGKQLACLHAAIADVQFDRHKLRLLVKRTRYLMEAFPGLSPLSKSAAKLLKGLQSALGDWHHHYQWCQRALVEKDLLPLRSVWSKCTASALQKAEIQLSEVLKQLPKLSRKKQPKVAAEERARVE
jgi:CHAD domain-containing protein